MQEFSGQMQSGLASVTVTAAISNRQASMDSSLIIVLTASEESYKQATCLVFTSYQDKVYINSSYYAQSC